MARGTKLEPKPCEQCGDLFSPGRGEGGARWAARKFCSHACYRAASRGTRWKIRTVRACAICGDEFTREREDHRVDTCGKPECRERYRREVVAVRRSETMRQQYASGEREPAGARERALWPYLKRHGWCRRLRWSDTSGSFELDFAHLDLRLNVELDGLEHTRELTRRVPLDKKRDAALARRGWKILRVPNAEVDESPRRVAARVRAWADSQR